MASARIILDLMKGRWPENEKEPQFVPTYMQVVQRIHKVGWKMVKMIEKGEKTKMTTYYDKHARERLYCVGDTVLAMFPEGHKKMGLEWKEPCQTTKKHSYITYLVQKGRETCVLQVLMLEKWKEPKAACLRH